MSLAAIKDRINKLGVISENITFSKKTTFKIGGHVALYIEPYGIAELGKLVQILNDAKVPYYVIGNGTNILASDDDFDIVLICLKRLNKISEVKNQIILEAGVQAPYAGRQLAKRGYDKTLFMAVIPGTIGGLINMNAKAYHQMTSDCLERVDYINQLGNLETCYMGKGCNYPKGLFQKNNYIVVRGYFSFPKKLDGTPLKRINEAIQRKKQSQPLGSYNAGSVFSNTADISSWKLIDKVGFRGYQLGDAKVSDIHTNFFINMGKATFNDMMALLTMVESAVYQKYHISLVREIEIVTPCDFPPV